MGWGWGGEKRANERRRRGGWARVVIPSSPLASLLLYNPAQVAHSPADPKEKGGLEGVQGGTRRFPCFVGCDSKLAAPIPSPQGGRCGHRKGGQPTNSCHPPSDKRSQPVPRIISLMPLSPRVNSSLRRHFNLISARNLLLGTLEFGSGGGVGSRRGIWGRAGLF